MKKNNHIIGKTFHELTVLEHAGKNKHGHNLWKCLCSCGSEKILPRGDLNRTRSCGCLRKGTNKNSKHPCHKKGKNSPYWTGHGEISGYRWIKIQDTAKRRKKQFDLSIEDAWNLFLKQDRKCALSGLEIKFGEKSIEHGTASLDRIDSARGYTKENVQWLHKEVNKMKMDLNEDRFKFLCKIITENT